MILIGMRYNDDGSSRADGGGYVDEASLPVVIATMLREEGITGVHTHVRQLRRYLEDAVRALSSRRSRGAERLPYPFSAPASH